MEFINPLNKRYPRGHSELWILETLLNFSREKPELKLSYVDDVIDFLDEKGFITEKQLKCLNRIYIKYCVEDFMCEWKK